MARRVRWLWHLPLVAAVALLRPASAAGLFFRYAANAVAALALCEWLLRREGEAVTAARYLASGVVLAVYVLANERRPVLLPVLAVAWGAAVLLARSAVRGLERRTGGGGGG